MLSEETIGALRALDTPTVSNAIESFGVRPRTMGHADARIRCLFPELGAAVGYAVTFTSGEYGPGEKRTHAARPRLYGEGGVADGVVRDTEAMRAAGFKTWAAGTTPSRGDVRVVDVNVPVSVGGLS